MHVAEILSQARKRLAVVDVGASIKEASGMMSTPGVDLLVVADQGGAMVGVVTKTDIVAQAGRSPETILSSPVGAIMTRDVVSCRVNDRLQDVWLAMRKRGVQRVPVIDAENKPIAVVYARDALQRLLCEAEEEDEMLREYISGLGYR